MYNNQPIRRIISLHLLVLDIQTTNSRTFSSHLKSYHDPSSDEDDVPVGSRIVAGMVTSPSKASQPEVETKPDSGAEDGLLEGEEKEDLPTQPPPIEQKPKESKNSMLTSVEDLDWKLVFHRCRARKWFVALHYDLGCFTRVTSLKLSQPADSAEIKTVVSNIPLKVP